MSNFSKGNELYNTRNYSDAINYYKKALDNDECKCHSYYNAGVCYIKLTGVLNVKLLYQMLR